MRHVDEGRLHAWLDGELPAGGADGADELERHLAGCPACRARADEERRIRDEASAILGGAVPGSLATPRTAPLPADDARPVRRRDGGRRWVAIGWAASVVLALGIGWTMRPAQREPVAVDVRPVPTPSVPLPPAPSTLATPTDPTPQATETPTQTEAPAPRASMPAPVAAVEAAAGTERAEIISETPPVPAPAVVETPLPALAPPAPPPPPAAAPAARSQRVAATPPPVEAWDGAPAVAPVTVRGRVTDTEGRPMGGARVIVPGTNRGAVTSADGSYALVLPQERAATGDSVTLIAQRIGSNQQVRLLDPGTAGGAVLNFSLSSSAVSLDALVVTGANSSAAEDGVAWREVERDEAERRLGRPLVGVPELPLLGIELGKMEGRAAVRVRQQREDGSVLSLVQQRAPRARARSARAEALRRAVEERGGWQIVLEEEGLVVEASEPVPADSLRRLSRPVRRP